MKELIEIAKEQLDERAKSLKWEIEKTLDQKVESIKSQLNQMAELQIPADILELYTKVGGKLWVSKRIWIEDEHQTPSLIHRGRNLLYANRESVQQEFTLPQGIYKIILMAIPSSIEEDNTRDDYGTPFRFK